MVEVAGTAIDVSRLPRQAGSMLDISREISAPADLSVAMATVVEGSTIELDATVESVVEGIWLSGTADIEVRAECSRCLDPLEWSESVSLEQMYRYPATDARGLLVEDADHEDDPEPEVVDDTIDIEPALRDAIVLALPLAPLCQPDCGGLCSRCGERIEDGVPHDHPSGDPRWAALEGLLDSPSEGSNSTTKDQ